MSPKLKASKGGRIEEDGDGRGGTEAGGSAFAGGGGRVEFSASGGADGDELSAGEAAVEALRGGMLAEGLWSRDRRRRGHRQRRERKARLGELVQRDGSFHDWREGRGPGGCLMNMLDEATGTTLCRRGKEETIWAAVGVLKAWMGCYGVPPTLCKVRVGEGEDGSLEILCRGQKLKWKEIAARPASEKPAQETPAPAVPPAALNPKWKPGPEHPGRRG